MGLTQFSTSAHIARALLEAICFQTRDVLEAMQKDATTGPGAGLKLARLRVDGGATANGGPCNLPRRAPLLLSASPTVTTESARALCV